MGRIDPYRVHYIRVALDHIDRHLNEYRDKIEQDDALAELIDEHGLEDYQKSRNWRARSKVVPLTVERYRAELVSLVGTRKKASVEKGGILELFKKGSAILDEDFLVQLEEEAASEESDGEEDVDAASNVKVEHQERNGRASSSSGANNTEGPNGIDKPSQSIRRLVDAGRDPALRTRPTASPITPSEPAMKKRKYEDEDERMRNVRPEMHRGIQELTPLRTTHYRTAAVQNESTLYQPERSFPMSRDSVAPLVESELAIKLDKLSDTVLVDGIDAIWTNIQSFVLNLKSEMSGTTKGQFTYEPNTELESLYRRALGAGWEKRASALMLNSLLEPRTFLEAIVAAATYNLVWQGELPWDGPQQHLESLGEVSKYLTQALRENKCALDVETLFWQGAGAQVQSKFFQEAKIRPYARKLADKFMMVISKMLKNLWKGKVTEAVWDKATESVGGIFQQAFILKGRIAVAPDEYRWSWMASGKSLDEDKMEELHESEGEQEVVWALTPLIEKKPTEDVEWQVLCPAKVLTRPKPEA